MRDRLTRLGLNIVAAAFAAVIAGALTSAILAIRGDSPVDVMSKMWDYGTTAGSELTIVNNATALAKSAKLFKVPLV